MSKAIGVWKNFIFKQLEFSDHPRVLAYLREYFYSPSMKLIPNVYQKSMDDANEKFYKKVLIKGGGLTLFAEDQTTGVIAGTRIVCMEERNPSTADKAIKDAITRSVVKLYGLTVDDCKIWERYPSLNEIPNVFCLSTHPDYQRQGLGAELVRRSNILLQEEGHRVVIVGYLDPRARARGFKNGFIQLAKRYIKDAVNEETGEKLFPDVDQDLLQDAGVIEFGEIKYPDSKKSNL